MRLQLLLRNVSTAVIILLALAMPVTSLWAQPAAAAAGEGVVLLDDMSSWRMYHVLKPPVVQSDGQLIPRLLDIPWLDSATPEPPADWRSADFDDFTWLRSTARGGCQTPYLARQCIRGKFTVTDPAKASGLAFHVDYYGGAVVYLNGKEIGRENIAAGEITGNTLAAAYPAEAYLSASGNLLAVPGTYIARGRKAGPLDADSKARIEKRTRRLTVNLDPGMLRKGVNVLAVELIRAPYHGLMLETAEQTGDKLRLNKFDWGTCQLLALGLRAASAEGLIAIPGRPQGFQLFNSDPMEAVGTQAFGDPCEPLRPLRLVAARNGVFSGKLVAASTEAMSGLRAVADDLRGPSGSTIAASAITIRYGHQWGGEAGYNTGDGPILTPYPQASALYGALNDSPPDEVALAAARPPLVPAAVMPIWVTVRVADNLPAGIYKGPLTISAAGQPPVQAEIEVRVIDCLLPGPQNQQTWVELIQAPEVLSLEYDAEIWSDRHFELIGKSLQLIRDSGSRVLHVSAIGHTNLGNKESMIRWIAKGDAYEWDFSIMDRYLDLAQKEMGEPKLIVLQVWEIYMSTRDSIAKRFAEELEQRHKTTAGRPLVTILDPTTGQTHNATVPGPGDPQARAIWQGLLTEVQRRLKARGLEDRLMLGMFTDAVPPREHMVFFNEIAPNLPWVQQGHGRWTTKVYGIAEVGYQATVWGGFRFADGLKQTNQKGQPIVESLYGWKEKPLDVVFERNLNLDSYPATRWRFYPETAITGELRGIGRVGADYWRVMKDVRGRRTGYAHDRYNEGAWGGNWINLNLCSSTLAPGPDGPIMTTRLVSLIEGVQEAEARIIIERALSDAGLKQRLGRGLADRCQKTLDLRLHNMWKSLSNFQVSGVFFFTAGSWRWTPGIPGHRWYLGSDWQAQSGELFELAGLVQKALK